MIPSINISRAQTVKVNINDLDDTPFSLTYADNTDPSNPVPIDLTDYAFSFDLKNLGTLVKNYSLASGILSNSYLTKGGTGTAVLDMTGMWADIKSLDNINGYRLIQLVTDSSGNTYVHVVYEINVSQY